MSYSKSLSNEVSADVLTDVSTERLQNTFGNGAKSEVDTVLSWPSAYLTLV